MDRTIQRLPCRLHEMFSACISVSLQIFIEELCDPVERNLVHIVIKIGMACFGDDEQFFVVSTEFPEGVFTEITGMGVLSVYKQYCTLYFTGIH